MPFGQHLFQLHLWQFAAAAASTGYHIKLTKLKFLLKRPTAGPWRVKPTQVGVHKDIQYGMG